MHSNLYNLFMWMGGSQQKSSSWFFLVAQNMVFTARKCYFFFNFCFPHNCLARPTSSCTESTLSGYQLLMEWFVVLASILHFFVYVAAPLCHSSRTGTSGRWRNSSRTTARKSLRRWGTSLSALWWWKRAPCPRPTPASQPKFCHAPFFCTAAWPLCIPTSLT